jgi:hypothetical protein
MRSRLLTTLVVVLMLAAMGSVVGAGSPITEKVTGGGHFISDAGTNVGDLVYLSLVGMEKSGEWSGQGSYRDPAIGFEAHLTFDDGELWLNQPSYICFAGTADVYIYEVPQGAKTAWVCVVDEPASGGGDGIVDRIGVVIGGTSYHYTHMGYSVTDYAGRIRIH